MPIDSAAHVPAAVVNVDFRIDEHVNHFCVAVYNGSPQKPFSLHNTIHARENIHTDDTNKGRMNATTRAFIYIGWRLSKSQPALHKPTAVSKGLH